MALFTANIPTQYTRPENAASKLRKVLGDILAGLHLGMRYLVLESKAPHRTRRLDRIAGPGAHASLSPGQDAAVHLAIKSGASAGNF